VTQAEKIELALELIHYQKPKDVTPQFVDRDHFSQVHTRSDYLHEKEWSGASMAGSRWSGAWAGGREL
jgi:hypothetical protein